MHVGGKHLIVIGIILLLIFEIVGARKPAAELNHREHRGGTENAGNVPNSDSEPQTGADERRPGKSNPESKP